MAPSVSRRPPPQPKGLESKKRDREDEEVDYTKKPRPRVDLKRKAEDDMANLRGDMTTCSY